MLIPLSWLAEYVDIKLSFEDLALKMCEAGMTIEKWDKIDGEIVFDPEVTPNRNDWLSVTGIAREIAAVTKTKFKEEKLEDKAIKIKNPLEITIKPNYNAIPRMVSVVIKNITIKKSPEWLQQRIKQIGLRPINNLVDITNYVLWEFGSPLHVFDYDTIRGKTISVGLTKGGEGFRSLDGIDYTLPKDAIVISDVGRIIDLPPLKGGENTSVTNNTKTILLHSVICDPVLTRRASQKLGLRSDSSAISERGVDPNAPVKAVRKAMKLILELAGGEVASEIIDHKEKSFETWTVNLNHKNLERIVGIAFEKKEIIDDLTRLGLEVSEKNGSYEVVIPTYRQDLQIEEDLIEEVVRLRGVNSLPRTIPASPVPTNDVAYKRDFDKVYKVKNLLKGAGLTEVYTYSLVSEELLKKLSMDPEKVLRVDNPISKEFEYLRPHLMGNLLETIKLNDPHFPKIKVFELGKIHQGDSIDNFKERYQLMAVFTGNAFYEAKGVVELIGRELNINFDFQPATKDELGLWLHPGRAASIYINKERVGMVAEIHPSLLEKFSIKGRVVDFTLNLDLVFEKMAKKPIYKPISKYPKIIEDITLVIPENITYQSVIEEIRSISKLVNEINLLSIHEAGTTIRVSYHDNSRNLTEDDIAKIRKNIEVMLKKKGVAIK